MRDIRFKTYVIPAERVLTYRANEYLRFVPYEDDKAPVEIDLRKCSEMERKELLADFTALERERDFGKIRRDTKGVDKDVDDDDDDDTGGPY